VAGKVIWPRRETIRFWRMVPSRFSFRSNPYLQYSGKSVIRQDVRGGTNTSGLDLTNVDK
jgi:hypothetical protein